MWVLTSFIILVHVEVQRQRARGGARASSISRIRSGWKCLGSICLFLHLQYFRIRRKNAYIQLVPEVPCCMAAKTYPLKECNISRIAQTDMQMVRWMCHVSLRDRQLWEELRNRLSIANIATTLRWFGHTERLDKESPANNYRFIEVGGQTGKARPRKTWIQLINDNLRKLRLQSGLVQNGLAWRNDIAETSSNPC